MTVKQVVPGLYQIGRGFVNAYLADDRRQLTLIGTGVPSAEGHILAALAELGKQPGDVQQIPFTLAYDDLRAAWLP